MDRFYQQAYEILSSPRARAAFDIHQEPVAVRERYGRTPFGQSCLLARRLIEAGVRFVSIDFGGWDTHQKNFERLKTDKLPTLDRGLASLLEDLDTRGLHALGIDPHKEYYTPTSRPVHLVRDGKIIPGLFA
jgi:curved DNA-binding protein CbpA